ncbi:MAG: EAL domain-containing protein [Pseudomonadota bacterium]
MRILLVEDDKSDAQLVELLLERDKSQSHDIEWVETVAEGVAMLETQVFDVALVDLSLPDACNDEAVTRLVAADENIPIVVLSGNDDEKLALSIIEGGAQDYLTKGSVGTTGLNRAMRYAVDRKATEVTLRERATVDILTGLCNRVEFETQLDRAMSNATRNGTMVGVLLIDLDHFKSINDTHGHAAGDAVLHAFGERLRMGLRVGDTGARLGGDEFAVLLENLESLHDVKQWVLRAQEQLRQPVGFDNVSLPLSMSIGAAVFPTHGPSIERILRCADVSMYSVKRQGRNGFLMYDERMEDSLRQRDLIEEEIRAALDAGHFVPHFQPQISLNDGGLVGLEAVCRWLRTDKIFAMPTEYIPLVQDLKLIEELGAKIFSQICVQIAAWRRANVGLRCPVSVKVDEQELLTTDYAQRVIRETTRNGVEPTDLRLELRNQLIKNDKTVVTANLARLAKAGFRFSVEKLDIDLISHLPVPRRNIDALKLNKQQTTAVFSERMAVPVTRALVQMANEIGIPVVGEGIETARQFRALQQLGCDQAQGYFIARPMNPDNLVKWLKRHGERQRERDLTMTGRFRLPPPLKRFQARGAVN